MKKINLLVRVKNPWFWIGLIATILSAIGVSPEIFTSWSVVGQVLLDFIKNPFEIGCVIFAILGVFVDPTTSGISDSSLALTYKTPKKEK